MTPPSFTSHTTPADALAPLQRYGLATTFSPTEFAAACGEQRPPRYEDDDEDDEVEDDEVEDDEVEDDEVEEDDEPEPLDWETAFAAMTSCRSRRARIRSAPTPRPRRPASSAKPTACRVPTPSTYSTAQSAGPCFSNATVAASSPESTRSSPRALPRRDRHHARDSRPLSSSLVATAQERRGEERRGEERREKRRREIHREAGRRGGDV